jgi:hypothetical protein
MSGHANSLWRTIFETYPCPVCGANPGEPCLTEKGNPTRLPHAMRTRNGNRCPNCGVITSWDNPGALCGRCELVRSLEVERATRYERKDP